LLSSLHKVFFFLSFFQDSLYDPPCSKRKVTCTTQLFPPERPFLGVVISFPLSLDKFRRFLILESSSPSSPTFFVFQPVISPILFPSPQVGGLSRYLRFSQRFAPFFPKSVPLSPSTYSPFSFSHLPNTHNNPGPSFFSSCTSLLYPAFLFLN